MKGKRVDNYMKEKEKKIHQRIKRLNVLIMEEWDTWLWIILVLINIKKTMLVTWSDSELSDGESSN